MPAAQHDTPARIVGLLVFFAGVGLLVWVFVAANDLFHTPPPPVPAPPVSPATAAAGGAAANTGPSPFVAIGASFGVLVRQILLLLLMSVAGSVIASKGIQLYFAARPVPGTAPVATTPPAPPAVEPSPALAANGLGAPAPPVGSAEVKPPPTATPKTGPS